MPECWDFQIRMWRAGGLFSEGGEPSNFYEILCTRAFFLPWKCKGTLTSSCCLHREVVQPLTTTLQSKGPRIWILALPLSSCVIFTNPQMVLVLNFPIYKMEAIIPTSWDNACRVPRIYHMTGSLMSLLWIPLIYLTWFHIHYPCPQFLISKGESGTLAWWVLY